MKRDPGQWLNSPPVSLRWLFGVTAFWVVTLMLWQMSKLSQEGESRVEAPLLFHTRNALGFGPNVHPRIKVYGFDDTTITALRRTRLSYDEWAQLLEKIDARNPEAIIIDALFSVTETVHVESDGGYPAFVKRLRNLKAPVVVGAFSSPSKIPGRVEIDTTDEAYNLLSYMAPSTGRGLPLAEQAAKLPLANFRDHAVYGPEVTVRDAFKRIGHILYGQREGRVYPFLRLSDTRVVPYIMLRAFNDVNFNQGHLFANGTEIPLASDGTALINFSSRREFARQVRPLRMLIQDETRDIALTGINSGDFVYLIPMHFTGNTDFKPSPIGLMPGAYMHLAMLNGLLQGNNLRPFEAAPVLILIFACIGALLAWWLPPVQLSLALLMIAGLWMFVWMGSFMAFGWVFPWLSPTVSLLGVGFSLLVHRTRESERKSQYIRLALEGSVQPHVLSKLEEHPERISLDARERIVSIMFVDIVGFSLMVENQLPRLAFESLRELIEGISAIVHQHGGIVNKTLGDGLLCFFGYSFEGDAEQADHAEKALIAATQIQRNNVPRMIRSARNREPVFPLRIGINTSAVFMGNLGSGQRLDFTVIGNGVNFAKRLEGACMPHSILVGPTTKELLEPIGAFQRAKRRMIAIKHHSDMVEAWEYDPFAEEAELRAQAEEAYRSTAYLTRLERRWTVAQTGNIIVTTQAEEALLLNFSATGMSIILSTLLARGTRLVVQIDSKDGSLSKQLSAQGLQSIAVEVRWVQNHEESFLHGVRYLELDNRQTDLITDLLCQHGLERKNSLSSREVS